jgi:hypothetical protein
MTSSTAARGLTSLTVAAFLVGFAASAQAQVLHTVPKIGQWVEFDGEKRSFDGTTQLVRARFSCVGTDKLDQKAGAWIEIEWTTRGQSDPANYPLPIKLLVPTQLMQNDDPRTLKCRFYWKDPDEPELRPGLTKATDEVVGDIRSRLCGCVPSKAVLTELGDEEILVGDRRIKTKTKAYRYTQTDSDGSKVEYRFWLAPEIPFGVAKYAYKLTYPDGSWVVNEHTVTKQGEGAQAQWTVPAK